MGQIKYSLSNSTDISNLFEYIHEMNIDITKEPYPTFKSLLKEDMSYTTIEKTLKQLLLELPQEKRQQMQNFIEGKI